MKKLGPNCDVVRYNSPPTMLLRTATGRSTTATPSVRTAEARRGKRSMAQPRITMIRTTAFSRVKLNAPSERPNASHSQDFDDVVFSAINHSARQTKNTSSTDFCSRPSKKIAGAYTASIRPATRPARGEKSRLAATARSTHEHDP